MTISLLIVLVVGAVIGSVLAWIVRGARANAVEASATARLDATGQNETRLREELTALETDHAALTNRLHTESSIRSAAEATAAAIPDLQARITDLLTTSDTNQAELRRLSTTAAETAQNLKSTTGQLEQMTARATIAEDRAASLGEQLRDICEKRATLESEASRIPDLEQRLSEERQTSGTLSGELTALKELHGRTDSTLAAERETLRAIRIELQQAREQLDTAQTTIVTLTAENTELSTRRLAEAEQIQAQMQILTEAKQSLSDCFKALSTDALKSNNQAFIDLATSTLERFQQGARTDLEARQKAVDQLVRPLAESLQKVDGKIEEIEKARVASYSSLTEQLKGLVETHLPSIRHETASLVKALRQPSVRGRWGEVQLRRVVEMAGMLEYCDFIEQDSRSDEEGRLLRPDLVIKLPGGRNVVIDAKAPIAAYLEAVEATDEVTQRLRTAQHAQQVRAHITALGRKAYWDQFSPSPDFVVMFIPGEGFFSAALQEDPSLIECGVSEKVIPATPTTLIALLRTVAYGWRQERLAQSAEEISKLGKELYERISTVGEHWSDVGDRLRKAIEAYNKSTVSLESRVMVSARRFRDLKVGTDDSEIAALNQVEVLPRSLQSEELIANRLTLDQATEHSANRAADVPELVLKATGTGLN